MSKCTQNNSRNGNERSMDKISEERIGLDIEATIRSIREKARQLRRESDRMNRSIKILEDIVKKRDLRKKTRLQVFDQEKTQNERST